jgi:hypothetical protein
MPSHIRYRRYGGEAEMRSGTFWEGKKSRFYGAAGEKAGETLPSNTLLEVEGLLRSGRLR